MVINWNVKDFLFNAHNMPQQKESLFMVAHMKTNEKYIYI